MHSCPKPKHAVLWALPLRCLQYFQSWANEDAWLRTMIAPALQDACFGARETLPYLGFTGDVEPTPATLFGRTRAESLGEDGEFLVTHMCLAASATDQLILYAFQPQSHPWSVCLLLKPETASGALQRLKKTWAAVLKLEASHAPAHRALLAELDVVRWPCFREVMEMLQVGGWRLESEAGIRALPYCLALSKTSLMTTLSL